MTLASRIRKAAKHLKQFRRRDLCDAVGVRSYRERRAVWDSFRDFARRGEIERIDYALYRYIGREERPTYRQRFWDIARRMIRFTLNDLEQITEARRDTVKEFCSWMVKKGYAQRVKPGHFKVIGRLSPVVPKYSKRNAQFNERRETQR